MVWKAKKTLTQCKPCSTVTSLYYQHCFYQKSKTQPHIRAFEENELYPRQTSIPRNKEGEGEGRQGRGFSKFGFISHYHTMIWLVKIKLISPSQVCFLYDNSWMISPCPYLSPQAFCYTFSPLCSWEGEQFSGFGMHLASSQDQPSTLLLCTFNLICNWKKLNSSRFISCYFEALDMLNKCSYSLSISI